MCQVRLTNQSTIFEIHGSPRICEADCRFHSFRILYCNLRTMDLLGDRIHENVGMTSGGQQKICHYKENSVSESPEVLLPYVFAVLSVSYEARVRRKIV